MPEPSRELIDLAARVADGTPDWTSASQADAASLDAIEQLRTIADIARLHAGPVGAGDQPAPTVREGPWGPLEIKDLVGSGRFGDVYRAFDPMLHRDVALKILRHPLSDPNPVVEEGRLAARVRHPNVVTIYGALCVDDHAGIWMEFIHGRTLEAELVDKGSLPARAVRDVGLALCAALEAVHAAGCVHRDVKASNVMREHTGRIVLGDFGTGSDALNDAADRRGLAGTPAYLAPEIFERVPATPQSDIYSLGVLLYRLATGTFPVAGRTLAELRASHARGGADSQRASIAHLGSLGRVIERAMHPDPARRFPTARAMAAALKPRASTAKVAAAIAGVVAILAAAAWLAWSQRPPRPGAGSRGIAIEQTDPFWASRAMMLGPAVGSRIPCGSREPGREGLAICDLVARTVSLVKPGPQPSARTGAVLLPDTDEVVYVESTGSGIDSRREVRITDPRTKSDRLLRAATAPVRLHRWHPQQRAIYATEGTRAVLIGIPDGALTVVGDLRSHDDEHDLSPDGRRFIVERRTNRGRDLVATELPGGRLLWSMDDDSDDFLPLWTPDGRGLVFASDRFGGHTLMFAAAPGSAAPATAVPIRNMGRTNVRHPAGFSPDGTLYFTGIGPARTLYLADIDLDQRRAGSPRVVEPSTLEDTLGGDWSPDGRQIAYLRTRLGSRGPAALVIRNVNGATVRELPVAGPIAQVINQVRWSPDGRSIAVLRGLVNDRVLDVYDLATGTSRTLLKGRELADPRWHPSSRQIDYADLAQDGADGVIRTIDVRTGRTTLRYDPNDGRLIAGGFDRTPAGDLLMRVRTPGRVLCRFRAMRSGSETRDFTFEDPACPGAAWMGSGPWFLASIKPAQELGALWMVNAESGERHRLALDSDLIFFMSLSPSGTSLLFTAGNPPPLMWTLTGLTTR